MFENVSLFLTTRLYSFTCWMKSHKCHIQIRLNLLKICTWITVASGHNCDVNIDWKYVLFIYLPKQENRHWISFLKEDNFIPWYIYFQTFPRLLCIHVAYCSNHLSTYSFVYPSDIFRSITTPPTPERSKSLSSTPSRPCTGCLANLSHLVPWSPD